MENIEKGKYGTLVKAGVLLLMFGHYANSPMSPISGLLRAAFPEQLSLVKMAVQINYIAGCIPLLLMGPLSERFTTKQISLAGLLFCSTGALVALLPQNIYCLLVTQFTTGIGIGIMYAYAASYIVNLWEGKEADTMMGNRSAVGACCGFFYQQFSGRVGAAYGYKYALLCLLVCILVFFFNLKALPKTYPVEVAAKAAAKKAKEEGLPKPKVLYPMTWICCLFAVMITMFAQTMMMDMGIVGMGSVEEGGLGITTSSTISNIMTGFSISMILSGILYPRVWVPLYKKYTPAGGVFMCAVGMLILMIAKNIPVLMIGVFIFGFGFQTFNAGILQLVPKTTIPTAAARSISLFWIFSNVGSFLASMVAPTIAKMVFPGKIRGDWYVSFVALCIFTLVFVVICKKVNDALDARKEAADAINK